MAYNIKFLQKYKQRNSDSDMLHEIGVGVYT